MTTAVTSRRRLARDLRTIRVQWQREMIRLRRNRLSAAMGLLSPLLYLLILGTGLSSVVAAGGDGSGDFRAYLFPGVLLMAAQAPALTVGASIVWDRQSGFLRQMLVLPVGRPALLTGLCLGGASTGAASCVPVLVLAGLVGVPYDLRLLVALVEVALLSFAFATLGVLMAVCIRRLETFQVVAGLSTAPMLFLSGAVFPASGLPGWLGAAVIANPLTYGVDALRRTLPGPLDLGGQASGPGWGGWTPPVLLELGIIALLALAALWVATYRFSRPE
ncbi:ABC transporter [Actinomadura rubrisoli]|uniref:Transport permease protein n=1 Tax=Actinomadura rubrisoli TaxID=2530368 RepID=A0A4R5C205_9ACTN|nr:ABC transporter [Actinomadura rubrisoli]